MFVSVIIPVFNHGRYLEDSIKSVIKTEYSPLEIVIVEDGSTDDSLEIAEKLRKHYPETIVILRHPDEQNHGESVSRNLGISAARGEAICSLDADDIMLPYRFQKAVELLRSDNTIDGVIDAIGISFEDERQKVLWGSRPILYGADRKTKSQNFLEATVLDNNCTALNPSWLVRKNLFEKSGLYSEKLKLSVDYDMWLRMAACGKFAVGETGRPIVLYRRHGGNMWVPDEHDSIRDLDVLRNVLQWAKKSPYVSEKNITVLKMAFQNKFRFCVDLLRKEQDRRELIKQFFIAAKVNPQEILTKHFIANFAYALLGK